MGASGDAASVVALLLAIFSSASLALIFRVTESRGYDRYVVTFANYVTAAAVAGAMIALGPAGIRDTVYVGTAVTVGIPAGALFFLAFILYQRAVAEHGPGLAGMYGKLGVLVPMTVSLALWREYPTGSQAAGMVLAVVAIIVSQKRAAAGRRLRPLLLLQLVVMGLAEFSNKVFEQSAGVSGRPAFLMVVFGVATIASGATLLIRRRRPRLRELIAGFAVGVPNLFSSFFLIAALGEIPAAVTFPVFSAGTIMVITAGAAILFRELPDRRHWAAVCLTAGALFLLN